MKPHLSEGVGPSGCGCGGFHAPTTVPRLRKPRKPEDRLGPKVYAALNKGVAVQHPNGIWYVAYSGDCEYPLAMSAHDSKLLVKRLVRCRRCAPCGRYRRNVWAYAAMRQAALAEQSGNRTWFGTLTLSSDAQGIMLDRARMASDEPNALWWDDPKCDVRFAAVRDQLVLECRRYWARLRKAGYRFKYLLVFERHKSGLPHMHWLLHEQNGPIRKRVLEAQWPWGFSKPLLCGGGSKRSLSTKSAAFYVAKYLSKDTQSRQIASHGYRKFFTLEVEGANSDRDGVASDSETETPPPRAGGKPSGARFR